MATKLTDTIVKALPAPEQGNRITYDTEIKGFGCRVTSSGARSFILNYRTRAGRERRFTIGSYPDWKTGAARAEAGELKKRIDVGEDPMAAIDSARSAPTIADLCDRVVEEHFPKCRPGTRAEYERATDKQIRPAFRHKRVAEVTFADIDGLHRQLTRESGPYAANRVLALLSKMFSMAVKWSWRPDNPCKGVERNPETARERYLSPAEIKALTKALSEHSDKQAANIVRMLLLTGARRGEVFSMRWADLDLSEGVWVKPAPLTKQARLHRIPLSAAARQLLVELREQAEAAAKDKKKPRPLSAHVFPGRFSGHRQEIKSDWRQLCIAAGIVTAETVIDSKGKERVILTPSARLHDLRHTYASILVSSGLSLPIIGALLGHSQPQTTARYSHLADDPLRFATERASSIISGKPSAEVHHIDEARR
jgi:integrase